MAKIPVILLSWDFSYKVNVAIFHCYIKAKKEIEFYLKFQLKCNEVMQHSENGMRTFFT